MISRAGALFLVVALISIARLYPLGDWFGSHAGTAMSLGFVMLCGYLAGDLMSRVHLPKITGYLFAGMIIGPYGGGVIPRDTVQDFLLINQIALALIALTAGGEFHLASMGQRWKAILSITFSQTGMIFILGTLTAFLIVNQISLLAHWPAASRWGMALVMGMIMVSQSPATTIALITETRSSGVTTETALGVAILLDVIVIILFTSVLMAVRILESGTANIEWNQLAALFQELAFSITAGVLAGIVLSFYLKRIRVDPVLFVLAFCYLVSEGSKTVHLDSLLVCLTAGVWVTNASRQGEELIKTIEQGSLAVYVIFFCVTGAALDLATLLRVWPVALLLVVLRTAYIVFSTYLGVLIARETYPSSGTVWMVFVPQAGVSLGLVALLGKQGLPWAAPVQTLIIGCIALNQIVGPILMKYALDQSGEAGKGRERRRPKENLKPASLNTAA